MNTESSSSAERSWLPLLFVIGVAALARGWSWWSWVESSYWEYFRADHAFYKAWGLAIASGTQSAPPVYEQGPLYAYFLAVIYSIFGPHDLWVQAFQLLAGIHTACLSFWIGRRLGGTWGGLAAGLIAALYAPLIYFELLVMKSWISSWLTTWCCLTLLQILDTLKTDSLTSRLNLMAASGLGFQIGLLCLVRESHLLLLFPVLTAILFSTKQASWNKRLLLPVTIVGVMFATTFPATIHNWSQGNQLVWITAGGGEVFFMGWGPEATGYYQNPAFVRPIPFMEHEDFRLEASRRLSKSVTSSESSAFWMKTAVNEALGNPARSFQLALLKVVILFNDFEVPDSDFFAVGQRFIPLWKVLPTFGLIVGFGILGTIWACGYTRLALVPVGFMLTHMATVVLTYNFARFRLGLCPLLCMLTGIGIVALLQGRLSSNKPAFAPVSRVLIATFAVLLSLVSFLPPPNYAEMQFGGLQEEFEQRLEQRTELLNQAITNERNFYQNSNPQLTTFDIAQSWVAAENKFRAMEWLERTLEQSPKEVEAWLYLGVLQAQWGQFSEAENTLRSGLEVNSQSVPLWLNLANTRFHQALQGTISEEDRREYLKQSLEAYEKALEIDPENRTGKEGREQILQLLE